MLTDQEILVAWPSLPESLKGSITWVVYFDDTQARQGVAYFILGTRYVLGYKVVISNPFHDPSEPPVGHPDQGLGKHVEYATAIRQSSLYQCKISNDESLYRLYPMSLLCIPQE